MDFKIAPSEEIFEKYFSAQIDTNYFPFLKFRFVFFACLIYVLIYLLFAPLSNEGGSNNNSNSSSSSNCNYSQYKCLKMFMFLHNMGLCIFSFLCFINTAPVAWELFNHEEGWLYACRQGWNDKFYNSSFGYWVYLFYLSKYYEFFDTWIVMLKGRRPIFLQLFHHVGAVIGCWCCVVLQSTGAWLFVIENSFVHSFMYFYYAMSVIGIKLSFKKYLTRMQMIQFIIGNTLAFIQMYIYRNIIPIYDIMFVILFCVYTSILFVLFGMFYKDTYRKNHHNNSNKKLKIQNNDENDNDNDNDDSVVTTADMKKHQ